MIFAFLIALYGIGTLLEMLDVLFSATSAIMTSYSGTVITVVITAYLTYRWYRARQLVEK